MPGERRGDVGEVGADRAARNPVNVVDRQRDRRHELEGVERRRRVVVPEHEPAERELHGDRRGKRVDGRAPGTPPASLDQGEVIARLEIGSAPEPEALVAARVPREVERPDGGIPPVERKNLEPRERDASPLVPRPEERQLVAIGSADRQSTPDGPSAVVDRDTARAQEARDLHSRAADQRSRPTEP